MRPETLALHDGHRLEPPLIVRPAVMLEPKNARAGFARPIPAAELRRTCPSGFCVVVCVCVSFLCGVCIARVWQRGEHREGLGGWRRRDHLMRVVRVRRENMVFACVCAVHGVRVCARILCRARQRVRARPIKEV